MDSDKIIPQEFDVFVSYSSKEKAIADAVVAAHEKAGIRCWYAPRDIGPGADWADSITKAIHDCSIMVLVFSKEANRSQRVIDEVNYAINQEKALLPFRVESSNPTGALSLHLSSRHWLDAYEPGWEDHIERLVKSVRINLPKTFAYLAGALIVVSLLGYFGWNYFGKGLTSGTPSSTPVESVPIEPAATLTETEDTSEVLPEETFPFTAILHGSIRGQEFCLDPQNPSGFSFNLIDHLFMTLTNYDIETATVVPGVAESWTISPDGRIYTFRLRADIPWVTHTLGGDTIQVTDEDGSPRYLTAYDFEYAYKRMCDPNIDGDYSLRPTNVQGCRYVLEYTDPEKIPPELYDEIGVEALSDTELMFYLEEPSGFFLTKTSSYISSAVPAWAMEKYSEGWTNPGLMPTNGDFVIDLWVAGESIRLGRNELFPYDLSGEGNIKTVELVMVEDDTEAYDLWKSNQIDYACIPGEELKNHLDQYPAQTTQVPGQVVYFMIFKSDKPPFDNVHLRRAFSAALNRSVLINEIFQDGGTPMKHLAPPGVFGAPPVEEVGVGYNLEYARAELELAGYPQCQGLPIIYFAPYSTPYSTLIHEHAEEFARSWEEELECPEGTINYQGNIWDNNGELGEWDLLVSGWGSNYSDEENWVGTVLYCGSNIVERSCNEIDELIVQAREEINASKRIELYRQIEESFFGEDGTFPIAPIYARVSNVAIADWFEYVQFDSRVYHDYSNWRIDMDAKEAARGE